MGRRCGKHREEHSVTSAPEEPDSGEVSVTGQSSPSFMLLKASEHARQLERLKERDPEFYRFLQEHDKELLEFNDEDIPDGSFVSKDEQRLQDTPGMAQRPAAKVITTAMVDFWSHSIRESKSITSIRSLLSAFRIACHCGDEERNMKFSVICSSVFNKIMIFVLNEMDAILRDLLKFQRDGNKRENIVTLMTTKKWQKHGKLVISYLANALHVLYQMTDSQMISFTLRRLRFSVVFLAASQSLLRRYIKVALHFWGTGGGALPVVSFLFLRDICLQLGSSSLTTCLKGIYKAYVLNCQSVSATSLQHIQFLQNCVTELYGLDVSSSYQHAFVFIRQLAIILRNALTAKTKESYRRVCERKYMNCLDLWTSVICGCCSDVDVRYLAYPLTQVIMGVARLVPAAKYFPIRVRCVRMLNQIAASTSSFIPVSVLLLDVLEMKELNQPSTGGFGKAIDFHKATKVSKAILKTRGFQEACIFSVVEELAEHLAQWCYSVAFFELSFVPLVRLRSYCKSTKVDKLRKEVKELICEIEASVNFINAKRTGIKFPPNHPAASVFLEAEKELKPSPLSQYVDTLRSRAQLRRNSMVESRVLVGEECCVFNKKVLEADYEDGNMQLEEGSVFNSSWLPGKRLEGGRKRKRSKKDRSKVAEDEDIVEDLILSSDEDETVYHPSSMDRKDTIDAGGQGDMQKLSKKRSCCNIKMVKS